MPILSLKYQGLLDKPCAPILLECGRPKAMASSPAATWASRRACFRRYCGGCTGSLTGSERKTPYPTFSRASMILLTTTSTSASSTNGDMM